MSLERNKIYAMHALDGLREMPDESVQLCFTSPPYFNLRDYKSEPQIWDGDSSCHHVWRGVISPRPNQTGGVGYRSATQLANRGSHCVEYNNRVSLSNVCSLCGAWRGELGQEHTVELYVKHLKDIFHEVHRVLRRDGIFYLNLSDSYATHASNRAGQFGKEIKEGFDDVFTRSKPPASQMGLKEKDLCGIPWRVAFALQGFAVIPGKELNRAADLLKIARETRDWEMVTAVEGMLRGWSFLSEILDPYWLRSDIIWSKRNCMPSSATDRPTTSHEYIFMLTKSGTTQFWTHRDLNGVRKQPKPDYRWIHETTGEEVSVKPIGWTPQNKMGWIRVNLWEGHDYLYDAVAARERSITDPNSKSSMTFGAKHGKYNTIELAHAANLGHKWVYESTRNLRSVWTLSIKPRPENHFASFPDELCSLVIEAGSSHKACSKCRAAWMRVVGKNESDWEERKRRGEPNRAGLAGAAQIGSGNYKNREPKTLGFRPSCDCENDGSGRCLVLDPFMGRGTVADVARKLGRDFIGFDLNPEYVKMAYDNLGSKTFLELLDGID